MKILNFKSKARNPKQYPNSNAQNSKHHLGLCGGEKGSFCGY